MDWTDKVRKTVQAALEEDLGVEGDISSSSIFGEDDFAEAILTAKENGVIAGIEVARMVLSFFTGNIHFTAHVSDGDRVQKGDTLAVIAGPVRVLLAAERTMLNFMQRMSGIATMANRYQEACRGTKCRILDTRKTAPGLRFIDKLAVRAGGAYNHRMGLFDMVMLKDNHIKAAGGITAAVQSVRKTLPLSTKIEVETTNLAEVSEALEQHVDLIMLDNMSNEAMLEAVRYIGGRCLTEASGNMTLERIPSVAALGVDYISVGALTHSVKALDISMNFKENRNNH